MDNHQFLNWMRLLALVRNKNDFILFLILIAPFFFTILFFSANKEENAVYKHFDPLVLLNAPVKQIVDVEEQYQKAAECETSQDASGKKENENMRFGLFLILCLQLQSINLILSGWKRW